jgi:hypothetical protein
VKLISAILSLYILALTIVPCCTFDNCPDDKTKTEQTANHEKGDDDGCGNCSPFFTCEGCALPVISFESATFTIQSPEIKITYSSFIQFIISYNYSSIWQPPQLA